MPIGSGTLINVAAVLFGSTLGVLLGGLLPERTRNLVTDALGLVTLVVAGGAAWQVSSPALASAVGESAPMLIVLGAVALGGIIGSLLRIEDRYETLGGHLQELLTRKAGSPPHPSADNGSRQEAAGTPPAPQPGSQPGRQRFIQGFVTASLVFCMGPLTILGSLTEGLGKGMDQLLLKSTLDAFASIAFAATFGWGVAAAALSVIIVQGSLTGLGVLLGDFLPAAHLAAITSVGGIILIGVALRLLDIRQVKVGDLLPALIVAPVLVQAVAIAQG